MPTIEGTINEQDLQLLRESARVGHQAREKGNHPFGAVLADRAGKILLRAENTVNTEHNDCGHAETNLVLEATRTFGREVLSECTLYTSVEPCAMCSGAMYWANVGRVVYGISEEKLLEMTGDDPENQTFSLPCREIFDRGQKDIVVAGPSDDEALLEDIVRDHKGFWKNS